MSNTIVAGAHTGDVLKGILLHIAAGVQQDIDALPDRAGERVHDIRVDMKKLRAVIRLGVEVISGKSLAQGDKLARQLKEHFASARDKEVLRTLLRDLLSEGEASEAENILGLSSAASETEAMADPDAGKICRRLNAFVTGLKLEALRSEDVRKAWLRTYRSARRAMNCCAENKENDGLFHEWRKRVKELLYQSEILAFIPAAEAMAPRAQNLSSQLGAHHDLSLLCERLSLSLPGSHAEKVARSRKDALSERALEIGRELLATKPSRLQVDQ